MKRLLILIVFIFMCSWCSAQTNTFPSSGYVGVGTLSPAQNFVVSSNNQDGFEVYLNQPTGTVGLQSFNRTSSIYGNMRFDASQYLFLIGNVGIGTLYPAEKLSVNGKIRAHEVKVELANWPDYVFSDDYKLPTLKETQKHIKENGRLPGIPSAVEVKANGIELGEMNAKLLQKIEELTLHLIKKDKQLTDERNINLNQEERLKKLESKPDR